MDSRMRTIYSLLLIAALSFFNLSFASLGDRDIANQKTELDQFLLMQIEKRAIREEVSALAGFHEFKVITMLPFFEKMNRKLIYDAIENSLKIHGRITVSEKVSIFQSLLQAKQEDTVLFIVIDTNQDQVNGSLEILTEVEVTKNKQKISSAIWKKNICAYLPNEQTKEPENVVVNVINRLIESFLQDLNESDTTTRQHIFNIEKCQNPY